MEYQVPIESGQLAQFMSQMVHTHKCKNCAEKMENQTIFSAQQPTKMFLSHFANYHIRSKMGGNEI